MHRGRSTNFSDTSDDLWRTVETKPRWDCSLARPVVRLYHAGSLCISTNWQKAILSCSKDRTQNFTSCIARAVMITLATAGLRSSDCGHWDSTFAWAPTV